ncbi:hypothetical protein DNTS_035495 [Danionella cerebrum]|uniref:Uncharacterized protein n=1 Tax=Danionella cerebrum TaxID=2873325 RepID=A0A553R689_9TELE|nr:hypothetical protein DNTS_035495 [Danionella translucida]
MRYRWWSTGEESQRYRSIKDSRLWTPASSAYADWRQGIQDASHSCILIGCRGREQTDAEKPQQEYDIFNIVPGLQKKEKCNTLFLAAGSSRPPGCSLDVLLRPGTLAERTVHLYHTGALLIAQAPARARNSSRWGSGIKPFSGVGRVEERRNDVVCVELLLLIFTLLLSPAMDVLFTLRTWRLTMRRKAVNPVHPQKVC